VNGLTLAQRLAVAEFLARHFGTTVRKNQLNPEAAQSMDVGERHGARFGGRRVAWVSMPTPATRAAVVNEAAFLAWVKEALPDEVETVERVRPGTAKHLAEMMKVKGGWTDEDGNLIPIPGIRVSTSDPSPRVELEDDAEEAIREAWRAGEIDLGEFLALPAVPEAVQPPALGAIPRAELSDEEIAESFRSPPFADEHGFLDPVTAAGHAVIVQGGFTTPPVEAYRMLRDGGIHAARALAWMEENGLDPADPREGKDTPWPLPAASDAEAGAA
jgi:hypothetical protein